MALKIEQNDSFEDAIRKAISIGGDSDTIACMTEGIAEANYKKIPAKIRDNGLRYIDIGSKNIINAFLLRNYEGTE